MESATLKQKGQVVSQLALCPCTWEITRQPICGCPFGDLS